MSRTTFFDSYESNDRRIGRNIKSGRISSSVYTATLSDVQRNILLIFESGSPTEAEAGFKNLSTPLKKKNWLDYWLLVTAVRRGHISLVKFLLENRCRVRIPIEIRSSCTPLYYASLLDDQDLVNELTAKGARNWDIGVEPIVSPKLTRPDGTIKIIDLVLCNYNFSNAKPDDKIDTAIFHMACWRGNLQALELFVEKNFPLTSRSRFIQEEFRDFTPLHFAMYGTLEAISFLLEKDADFHATDMVDDTPLHVAFKRREQTFGFFDETVRKYIRIEDVSKYCNAANQHGLSHFHIICSTSTDSCAEKQKLDQYKREQLNIIQFFLDNLAVDINGSVSLEHADYPGFTALHFAVNKCTFEVLESLLMNDADPNKCEKTGLTPLHMICKSDSLENHSPGRKESVVKLLLDHGANVDIEDSQKYTPLHYAFNQKQKSNHVIDLLLSKSQQEHINQHGLSHLHIACARGDISRVQILLSNGASVEARTDPNSEYYPGFSALHFAVMHRQKVVIEYLLDNGADVNCVTSKSNMTPLQLACLQPYTTSYPSYHPVDGDFESSGQEENVIEIVKFLLEHGASTGAKDSSGKTAMNYACQIPEDEIMKHCDGFRRGSLYRRKILERVHTRQKRMIEMLSQYTADIDSLDDSYKSTLHMLIGKIGDHDAHLMKKNLVEILLNKGADVDATNEAGLSLLHVAVVQSMTEYSYATFVDLLLKYRAQVNSKSLDKLNTPLHLAAEHFSKPYNMKVIMMLLGEPDIDLNAQNCDGDTPLHIASKKHLSILIKKLLRCGADISIENVEGKPPIAYFYEWVVESPSEFLPGVDDTFASSYRYLDNASLIFIMILHMKRLKKLKHPMSKEVETFLDKLFPYQPEGAPPLDKKIDEEVESMKSMRIDSFTTMYDILLKDPTDIANHLKNKNFKRLMTSSQLKSNFKRFWVMLEQQFERGIIRNTMLEDGKKALNRLTDRDWPDSCSEHILRYLSNGDLKKIIELEPNKRILKRKLGQDLLEIDSIVFPKTTKVEPENIED